MIRISISFFIIAITAYALGAYQIAGISSENGKMFLVVFLALALLSFMIYGLTEQDTKSTFYENKNQSLKK